MEPSHPSDYIDLESKSVESYVKLAEDLVAKQKPEHSLVAWERVLDSAQASPETIKEAFEILKLHKPVIRNEDSGIAISISLHASVPADLLERMEKLLRRTALIIELGSGYSLSVTPEVSVVAVRKGKPRPPVSVWFSGKNESTRGSLHTKSAKDLGLDDKVNTTIFNIVGPFIDEYSELTPVQDIHNEINVEEALAYLITRHSWRQFGLLLYQNLEQE